MMRWVWCSICAVCSLLLLICGWLVPVYLRAVDVTVLQKAGRNTHGLIAKGLEFAHVQNLGVAQLLLRAAQSERIPGQEKLGLAVTNLLRANPRLQFWGYELDGTMQAVSSPSTSAAAIPETLTEFLIHSENRQRALALLQASSEPTVQGLLQFRTQTNTTIFPASESASGQALDTAISLCGLMVKADHLTPSLNLELGTLAGEANRGGDTQRFEQALLDILLLGQQLNWGQLVAFIGGIDDVETLRRLANQVRQSGDRLPLLLAAMQVSGTPVDVADYLTKFGRTGLADLGSSLRFGVGGVKELLQSKQRLYNSKLRARALEYDPFGSFIEWMANYSWRSSGLALSLKWLFYLGSGFLMALAVHFSRPVARGMEQALQVRGFHLAREFLFALGFLGVVLLLSEPFLAQESQKVEFPFRLRVPMVGSAGRAASASAGSMLMNQTNLNLITMLLFFVLQGLLYTACLVKLAEIRRQKVPPRIKLRLLENEEHLFDAGLYLGFLGTIVSFVVYSIWAAHQFSLMVAYSSTSFGIIFVSFFKICHLRPLRRKLLLDVEATQAQSAAPIGTPALTTPT